MNYAPKKISFVGEENFIVRPNKTKRVFFKSNQLNAAGTIPMPPTPVGSPVGSADPAPAPMPTDYAVDIPVWDSMSCSELGKSISDFQATMSVIKVGQTVYDLYATQLA